MIVEPYSERYFMDVVKLIENFHKEAVGEYDNLFDLPSVIETVKQRANEPGFFIMIVDGVAQGILFGVISKSMLNERLVFQEVIWYVNEAHRGTGLRLFGEVVELLKAKGVSSIIMAVLENSKTEKLKALYTSLGFKPMETHYVRSI